MEMLRPRPMKRARSDSYWVSAVTSPSTTAKCAAQIGASSRERGRRAAMSAPNSGRYSVCTNILAKAGCALSAATVVSTSSLYDVSSISRARRPLLTSSTRRTSPSSSPETSTSMLVASWPSRRMYSAWSSPKRTSRCSGPPAGRLRAGRPHGAAGGVAQEDERAPVVARRVLAPARDGDVAPAAVARPRGRQHHRVAPVGQQVRDRRAAIGAPHAPHRGRRGDRLGGRRLHFLGPRVGHGHVPRHALLQQQLAGLDHRFAMEALAHPAFVQGVRDGDDGHALVMRHEAAHDREPGVVGQPGPGEIHGLVEAIAAGRAHVGEAPVVAQRTGGIDHGGQARRVGRDHDVVRQAALEAQARHAEIGILVGEFHVAGVVGRLRDAPGNVQRLAIGLLALHHQPVGLLEQAAGRCAHHQRRHQVLEHGAGPGDQRRAMAQRRRGAAEAEPVARGHVALGDGEQAGQPRLGSEQVVAAGVEPVVGQRIADRQQLALGVEQEREVHRQRHLAGLVGEQLQARAEQERRIGQLLPVAAVLGQCAGRGLDPEHQVRGGAVLGHRQQLPRGLGGLVRQPLERRRQGIVGVALQRLPRSRPGWRRARARPRRSRPAGRPSPRGPAAGCPPRRPGRGRPAAQRSTLRRRWPARSGGRPGCRCRPTTHRPAPAAAGRACRTSCRSGP